MAAREATATEVVVNREGVSRDLVKGTVAWGAIKELGDCKSNGEGIACFLGRLFGVEPSPGHHQVR
jgi:hypothetical protein